jgi:hypothetical protein
MGADVAVAELSVAYQDPSCTHILFAACHDMSYEYQLESYAKTGLASHAITLVHGACFKEEFSTRLLCRRRCRCFIQISLLLYQWAHRPGRKGVGPQTRSASDPAGASQKALPVDGRRLETYCSVLCPDSVR